jgi:serine/threonine protein kinase
VRPSNILLFASGNAYVSDFVLAGRGRGPCHPARVFLAPEQRDGRPPGPAADIYALGVLASVMLIDVAPDELTDDVDAPADVVELVRRATAPTPAARFEQVDDLLAAIRGLRHHIDAVETC